MADCVVLLSIPQLRHRDVTPGALASLEGLCRRGALAEIVPPFPGLAASSFATLVTGTGPYEHGMIGNTYYDRKEKRVVPSPLGDSAVLAPRVWNRVRAARPGAKTLVWFAPNTHGVDVDFGAWVDPADGVRTQPASLSSELSKRFGPFPDLVAPPQEHRPLLATSGWILKTAAEVIAAERPDLAVVRVPYLGQVARRFGPDGRAACRALGELEGILAQFLAKLPAGALILAVTESVTTPVSAPIYPNRILRAMGVIALQPAPGGGLDVDLEHSAGFALADHQICHIYLNDHTQEGSVAAIFSGPKADGIALVAPGALRTPLGLDHPRAGDIVLVAEPDRWFAPDWWKTPQEAPRGGQSASGLAQEGLLDPAHVQGSLGAPAPNAEYHGVIVASEPSLLGALAHFTARDVAPLVLQACGAAAPAGSRV
jgi:predicted AlkP superfamily pyrophosphatase or phosphodiesterase